MNKKSNQSGILFPFKHWLGTLFIGPFISDFLMKNSGKMDDEYIGMVILYPITVSLTILASIPTGLIYLWWYHHLKKNQVLPKLSKWILILISVLGINTTLYLINRFEGWHIMLGYSLASVISAHLFSLWFIDEEIQ